jgi:hypothetical protein
MVNAIERGLSRREAAQRFGVSASSAIRWHERLIKLGDIAPRRQGGDRRSGRIEAEAEFLLGAVAETPDKRDSGRSDVEGTAAQSARSSRPQRICLRHRPHEWRSSFGRTFPVYHQLNWR